MTTALLEPSFVAAHLVKSRQAGGTRVGFADFPASESGAKSHPAKRSRRDPVEIGHSAEESRPVTRPSDKYSYDSMYENLVNPDRPGFLESLTVYPPYEPESDERAIDDEVVTNANIAIMSFLTATLQRHVIVSLSSCVLCAGMSPGCSDGGETGRMQLGRVVQGSGRAPSHDAGG